METTQPQHTKKSKKNDVVNDKKMTLEDIQKKEHHQFEHLLGHRLYIGTHSFHKPMSSFLELVRDGDLEQVKTQLSDFLKDTEPGPSAKSDEIANESNGPLSLLVQKNEKGKLLNTALHIATYFHQHQVLDFLLTSLSKTPDFLKVLNLLNKEHRSALHISCFTPQGLDSCVTLLGVTGISINIQDGSGVGPIHIAAFYGNEKIVTALADAGADLNLKDNYGNTALHYAVVNRNELVVKSLVTRKADVRILNKEGKTPLHISTDFNLIDMSDILTSNGGDVSIRYQYKKELDTKRKILPKEEVEEPSSVDKWGYIDDDHSHVEKDPRDKMNSKKEKKLTEKESSRARRWAPMIIKMDKWLLKKSKKVKSRIQKGLPDALRPEAWKQLCRFSDRDPELYKKMYSQDSPYSEQIDLDINRSYRNHVYFRERFGKGQIALFNILKAYSNYDKEVGYVQGMSDISAFLLMYLSEEDTFWVLVQILNDKRYNMRGMFLVGFPLLHQHFFVMEKIIHSKMPHMSKHFKTVGIESPHYLTRWFLLVFLNSLSFPVIVRIWDMFLLKGFDFLFSVAYGLLKMNEEVLMESQMDGIFMAVKSLEKIDMNPDVFIKYVLKHKIDSKSLRKYEKEFQASKSTNVDAKKKKKN